MANDSAPKDPKRARNLGRASYVVSTVGIIVSVIIIAIVCKVYLSPGSGPCIFYEHDGVCYKYKNDSVTSEQCSQFNGYYDGFTCYFNY